LDRGIITALYIKERKRYVSGNDADPGRGFGQAIVNPYSFWLFAKRHIEPGACGESISDSDVYEDAKRDHQKTGQVPVRYREGRHRGGKGTGGYAKGALPDLTNCICRSVSAGVPPTLYQLRSSPVAGHARLRSMGPRSMSDFHRSTKGESRSFEPLPAELDIVPPSCGTVPLPPHSDRPNLPTLLNSRPRRLDK
jgi:hypothetical protein